MPPVDPTLQIPLNPQPSGDPQLAYKNNNPGNLQYANQPGAMPGEKGFARFATPDAGAQALHDQLALDQSRNLTLAQFVKKYAPPGANDTQQYTQQAMRALGMKANTSIASVDRARLAGFVAHKESGTDLSGFTPKPAASWLDPYIRPDNTRVK
jgi:hypothetical protein